MDAPSNELDPAIFREAAILKQRVGSFVESDRAWDDFQAAREGVVLMRDSPRGNPRRWGVAVASGIVAASLVALVVVTRDDPTTERPSGTTPSLPTPEFSTPPVTTTPAVPDASIPTTAAPETVQNSSSEPTTTAPLAGVVPAEQVPVTTTQVPSGTILPVASVESELSTPSLGFTADSRHVVMTEGKRLVLANATTGKTANRLDIIGVDGWGVVSSQTRIFDGETVWDLATGDEVAHFVSSRVRGAPWPFALSPDGRTAATESDYIDGSPVVSVYDVETGKRRYQIVTDKASDLHGLSFNPDGTTLLTVAGEGLTSQVWDVATGDLLFGIPAAEPTMFTADGRHIVTGNFGWTAYDAVTGEPGELHAAMVDFNAAPFEVRSANGTRSVIGMQPSGSAASAVVYDTLTGDALVALDLGNLPLFDGAKRVINADGTRLIVTDLDGITTVWDLTTGASLGTLAGGAGGLVAVTFSPDRSKIAAVTSEGNLHIWPAP